MSIHGFAFPTSIRFGPGARTEVAAWLAAGGHVRPLVVTDRGLAALPVFERFRDELKGVATAVFTTRMTPTASSASAAARRSTSRRRSR